VKVQGSTPANVFRVGYGLTAMNVSEYVFNYYDDNIDVDLIRGAN
jgi:hypothetical protein